MELDYVEVTGRYDLVLEFYKRVGSESIYMRFLAAVFDVGRIYEYIWEDCGGRSFMAYEGRRPVALVDVTPCRGGVEAAIVVADELQSRGYGSRIARDFARVLPKMGYPVVTAQIYRENYKALALARKMGASIRCDAVMCNVVLSLENKGGVLRSAPALLKEVG
ncbi:MAG: GNAT family N-acetyltransferase [Thermoproteus sp. AZ2]|jgi:GNAT superfamily N-acetyltransferase|uniref:GNAT family N-acetyltransferase n=1 Tax=Thermoproteus sp. AZ2 TaxID=1609232 RepID=A0ACC6UZ68_9CREN|nr:MAG: GCN5 family acetyltransferase [Thermoproteus sp. AZ2]